MNAEARRLVAGTAAGIVALVTIVVLAGIFLREPLLAVSRVFVERTGASGVALGFYLVDGFAFPFPNDVFSAFGYLGGLSFTTITAAATVGSLAGGATAFALGRRLSQTGFFARIAGARAERAMDLVARYGAYGIAIAALTPIPYSLASWAAGALRMPFWPFALISLLRIPRIALYLWLIEIGAITTGAV